MPKQNKLILIKVGIVILLALFVIGILFGWQVLRNNITASDKLRVCPDSWIDNQMPCVGVRCANGSYYILNGKRRELTEFDQDWVKMNCKLSPSTVY